MLFILAFFQKVIHTTKNFQNILGVISPPADFIGWAGSTVKRRVYCESFLC